MSDSSEELIQAIEQALLIGDLDAVVEHFADAAISDNVLPESPTLLRYRAFLELQRLEPENAIVALRQGSTAATNIGNILEEVHCLGELATVASLQASHDKAKQAIVRLNQIASKDVDKSLGGWISLYRGRFHLIRRELLQAQNTLNTAKSLAEEIQDRALIAECCSTLIAIFSKLKSPQDALQAAEAAFRVAIQNPILPSLPKHAFTLFNMMQFCGTKGNPYQVISETCQIFQDVLTQRALARSLGSLGHQMAYARWNGTGIPLLEEAIRKAQEIGLEREELIWRADLGTAYLWLGQHVEGSQHLFRAILGAGDLNMQRLTTRCLLALADDHSRQGAFVDAQRTLNEADEMVRKLGDTDLRFQFYLQEAYFALVSEHSKEAKFWSVKASEIARSVGLKDIIVKALTLHGEVMDALGEEKPALESLQDAFVLGYETYQFYEMLSVRWILARIAVGEGLFDEANGMYRILRNMLERSQGDYYRLDWRLLIQQQCRSAFEEDLHVCLALAQSTGDTQYLEESFDVAQKFHNRTSIDIIAEQGSLPSWIGKTEITNTSFSEEETSVTNEAYWRNRRIVDIFTKARNFESHYISQTSVSSLDRIQRTIDSDTLFLECVSLGVSYIFLPVTKHQIYPFIQVNRTEVDAAIELLYQEVTNCSHSTYSELKKRRDLFDQQLELLYEMLPVGDLRKKFREQRLIIAPDDKLARLPFHALRNPHTKDYVIDEWQLGLDYSPSASFYELSPKRVQIKNCLLISPDEQDLFAHKSERQKILNLFRNVTPLLAQNATVEALIEHISRSDVLYFIGHGSKTIESDALSSYIQLYDGPLTAADLFKRTIILRPGTIGLFNCCLIGQTDVGIGDELTGFIRGLFHIGMSTIVAPLWQIEDETAAVFMPKLCELIRAGEDIGSAIQQSIQFVRNDWHHPELATPADHPFLWGAYQWWGR